MKHGSTKTSLFKAQTIGNNVDNVPISWYTFVLSVATFKAIMFLWKRKRTFAAFGEKYVTQIF